MDDLHVWNVENDDDNRGLGEDTPIILRRSDIRFLATLIDRAAQKATAARLSASADPVAAIQAAHQAAIAARTALRFLWTNGDMPLPLPQQPQQYNDGPALAEAEAASSGEESIEAGSLADLASLNTRNARRFLYKLESAAEAGLAWDAERSKIDTRRNTEDTDGWADYVWDMATIVRCEIFGHPGAGRE